MDDRHSASYKQVNIGCLFRYNADATIECIEVDMQDRQQAMSDDEICSTLSISQATLKNWIRLKKIVPDLDGACFSYEYIQKIADDIRSGKSKQLKSRRNKKGISGRSLYKDYVGSADNQQVVEDLLKLGDFSDTELVILLANYAVQLYLQISNTEISSSQELQSFLGQTTNQDFIRLIGDLLACAGVDAQSIKGEITSSSLLKAAFMHQLHSTVDEDTLGFVYISLRDIGQRKHAGAYYTPKRVVDELITSLQVGDSDKHGLSICDPCCGTGNFLISVASKYGIAVDIYGQDIDPISVCIARINLFIMDIGLTADYLREHIRCGDSLLNAFDFKFDVVLGNPPWGSVLKDERLELYKQCFVLACGKGVEAYDLFIDKSLSMLKSGGSLAFVLPEAVLNVASHRGVRKLLLDSCIFNYVSYLGNVFSGVQCPSIILNVATDNKSQKNAVKGCRVAIGERHFYIGQDRKLDAESLVFNITDEEYACLQRIESAGKISLKGNARFALGIVTGNNAEFIKAKKAKGYEVILKGSDIYRYSISPREENYIKFEPELFQQVAPSEIYRAPEKLFYRFICDVPVFTYDNAQRLSLNSCNIVIPSIQGIAIKYVLAVLNSSVVAFWLSKKFNSVKLLRSHIEQIPIPAASEKVQDLIVEKVDMILDCKSSQRADLFYELDKDITKLYKLSKTDTNAIQAYVEAKNLFIQA